MIGEDTCCGATRAMLTYARALLRGEDTPRLGKDGIDAANRLFVLQRRSDEALDATGDGLEITFASGDRALDLGRMFAAPDRRLLLALIDACAAAGEPGVLRARGAAADGSDVDVEFMLSPLPAFWSRGDRFLGHVAPLGPSPQPIVGRLAIAAILAPPAPRPRPGLKLVVSNS